MSVNLYSFVEDPFTNKASFNYDKFKDVVYKAQRLMDDVVDLEEEKINKILNKIENDPEPEEIKAIEKNLWLKIKSKLLNGRRTGLSAIGLADTFAGINTNYGSKDSIKVAEEIYKQFAISAYKSSIDMAKERGAFPIWNFEKEQNNSFLKRLISETNFLQKYASVGRRNIALLTIPPSGTISLLAGISSGIEPVYQLHYKRRRKLEKGNPKITFVDQNGDSWEEYVVYHPKYDEWLKTYLDEKFMDDFTYGESIIKESDNPYYQSTAYEIDPLQKVKLQGTIQKWIDHSISSTINLPEDTTEKEVSNIYMQAWKEGCKGITIYRDNCRTGVLVSDTKKDIEEFKQNNAPKRPKTLTCEIHTTTVKGNKFYVIIGLLNNKPYEVFAINSDLHYFSKNTGSIIKISKGKYNIQEEESDLSWEITEQLSDEEATITRLVSTSLRHGADIKFIVEQLNKTHGDLTQFGKAIARVLKKYIADTATTKELCPNCESKLVYQDGCVTCLSCGYSKCG